MQINKIKSCWLQDHYTALARNHEWKQNHVHLQLLMSQIVLACVLEANVVGLVADVDR